MLWEPHIEGRNAHATLFEIYFKDPFLAYVYIASIPIFIALYQAFKVLEYIRQDKTFSQATGKAMRAIKYCAITVVGFVAVSVIFLMFADKDDRPAGVFMRVFIAFPSILIATVAAMFERNLQNAVGYKIREQPNGVRRAAMASIINVNVMLESEMRVTELAEKVGNTMANSPS